ncbi:MAG: monomeric [FeFe] hydrogenase [Candidatus Margulisbacteria bacterium]|jgi:[FeFe] hydrogenase (group B1/B3)|nr:monomeric [FeFe] hydrogenase [Candidatus Margulisiibacteriota bacterium]
MRNSNSQAVHLKKEILVRLAAAFLGGDYPQAARLIPYDMRPKGSEVPFRCCIHKERAILKDRVIAGMGFAIEADDEKTLLSEYAERSLSRKRPEDQPLTVLGAACRGCVPNRIYVTDLCQGCVARECQSVCKFGAISIVNGKSAIDGAKCKNCKMCVNVCPYKAIVRIAVPCEDCCPVGAITKNPQGLAQINFAKCIVCGKCLAACPFGAVHEKSQLIDVLNQLKRGQRVIALLAPSIAGQFPGSPGQLKTALQISGFSDAYEVALGADITASNEAREFTERLDSGQSFMTTSCCAGYQELLKKHLPEIVPFVSSTRTPLYYAAEKARRENPVALIVFIGPCVAKKMEGLGNPAIDYVLNYEELGALFIAQKIEILSCPETPFAQESSRQGKNFGFCGGVAAAVSAAAGRPERLKPCLIDGLNKDTIKQLKKMAAERTCPEGNLIEVMCCEGGCIGGNAALNTLKLAKKIILEYSDRAPEIKGL